MKKFLLSMVALAALAACEKNNDAPDYSNQKVSIDPIITKATDVNFENGDKVGLSIIKGTENYVTNAEMTFANNVFTGDVVWYSDSEAASKFVAYYPYSSTGVPTTFTVAADQNFANGFTASDLMGAVQENIKPSENAVTMVFKHLLSKVVFKIKNESGSDISSVVLKGLVPTANVDLTNLSVSVGSAAASNITAMEVTANSAYQAIIVPQTAAIELVVTTKSGLELVQKLASTEIVAGGRYNINALVTKSGLEIKLSGEIEDWDDKGDIPGDDSPAFEEHLNENYFMYDGVKYNTVKLSNGQIWMAQPMRYAPKGYTVSANPKEESHIWYPYTFVNEGAPAAIKANDVKALTDDASVEKYGYLYDFYAAANVKEVNANNMKSFEGVQGICPKGWHIPTRADYLALCGYSNKGKDDSAPVKKEDALFYDAVYDGGKVASFDAAGWNFVRTGARSKTNFAAAGQYMNTQLWSGNTSLTNIVGQAAMTYYLTSTYATHTEKDGKLTGISMFGLMTTYTMDKYPEGRVTLANNSVNNGAQLRCVRDAE